MRKMAGIAGALLAFLLPLMAWAEPWEEAIGRQAPEIALICADGTAFSLAEALAEKELAVVCLFGSGCGACRKELRALDQAYRLYQDRVAVIALSLDRTYDTDEALNAFQAEQGLAFPLGRDPARTARFMKINRYPAFMLVNGAGTVVYVEVNGPGVGDHFAALFDAFLAGEAMPDPGKEADGPEACGADGCPLSPGLEE